MRIIPLAALLALVACGGGDESADPDSATPAPDSGTRAPALAASAEPATSGAPTPASRVAPGVHFEPSALTKGARVGTVAADMLTLSRASDSSWVGQARFVGEITLSGLAIPHVDANVREVCFEPDAASAALLPRWAGDTRRAWFCFSNQPEAQQSLAALREKRPATVVIDRFTINKGQSDQENSAELVRVVSRGEPVSR